MGYSASIIAIISISYRMFPPHSVHKSVTHYQLCVAELAKCVLVSDYKPVIAGLVHLQDIWTINLTNQMSSSVSTVG